MPFALIAFGLILLIVAIRGKQEEAFALLRSEFTGSQNFLTFIAALGVVGAAGYVPYLRSLSRAFMFLILLSLLLSNQGFFAQFERQFFNRTGGPNPAPSSGGSPLSALPSVAPLAPLSPLVSST